MEESCELSLGAAVRLIIGGIGHIGTITRFGARGILAQQLALITLSAAVDILGHVTRRCL